jgi:hypothetical protein
MRLRPAIGFTEAATHERLQQLRVVRHRPVRAEACKRGEAWGQVLDKPPGVDRQFPLKPWMRR